MYNSNIHRHRMYDWAIIYLIFQSIAQSLHEQEVSALTRSDSRSSLTSIGSSRTSQEVAKFTSPPPPPTSKFN